MRDQVQQLGHFGLECVMGAHGVRMGFGNGGRMRGTGCALGATVC
jgi:hypothetical protein